ncbi:WD40 repeat-like protein [Basidiobolus meristosporus CBS 931.73]|uniref:Elongator complex protein 2 n=1 Tax=Basidiobolus meristosporus CBS 931.73 TaxID=1314790 RepID=A0A1Y1XWL9_9FUNG|nr:WD40 repeat-like protein [Basidiobolus meristosporus CBS 931.73]|eukprot:ORX89886.1 WD40 repeat-like protein [Basidiobolus meristosporus CBS 931.73]
MPSACPEFISVGCNKTTQASAWGKDGLVAFAAQNNIALYRPKDPSHKGVESTLLGHGGRVNCLQFINRGHEFEQRNVALVSGSTDQTVRVWKAQEDGKWITSAVLTGHTSPITVIGCVRSRSIVSEYDLFATGSTDGTIRIWERKEGSAGEPDTVECKQVIEVGTKYPLSLSISILPGSKVPIMACGSTDMKVHLYVEKNGEFVKVLSLQGHEDWVRTLAFTTYLHDDKEELMLASGSQDRYIRLWRIVESSQIEKDEHNSGDFTKDMLDSLNEAMSKDGAVQLSTKAHIIEVGSNEMEKKRYTVMLEALLIGHEDWVYSVDWAPATEKNGTYTQPPVLLSASADKSMMIWTPEEEGGVWLTQVRVGEVGGNACGFYGGMFGPDGKSILAHGYNGTFHLWGNTSENEWQPQVTISGHFKPVQNLAWDPTSLFFVSVSHDQTARLFAQCVYSDSTSQGEANAWHEIARPQVHGYDVQCLAFVDNYRYVSGSDEKVLRVFDAPQTFVSTLAQLTGKQELLEGVAQRPLTANLPALGLSNKAVFAGDLEKEAESEDVLNRQNFTAASLAPASALKASDHPPFEEFLVQHTLWPEVDKLYGHGYEIMCVGASHDGKYIASACKAASARHAGLRLFTVNNWKEITPPLASHVLTVTKVKFSWNDKYLLSVSRDRCWTLFEKTEDEEEPFVQVAKDKPHARIIWDCSWSHDDRIFATASRDKTVKFWSVNSTPEGTSVTLAGSIKLTESVTAIDFVPSTVDNKYVLAVGLETGQLLLVHGQIGDSNNEWEILYQFDPSICHSGTVHSLAWRRQTPSEAEPYQLATAGEDHSVRLFRIRI